LFKKEITKLKGQELRNLLKKRDEILEVESLEQYKNLSFELKKFKRVHVNNSFIILFFGNDEIVYFVDYAHHDNIYKHSKNHLKKYEQILFEERTTKKP
jgi:mRNA-degrading endonuclease RelE of RelBE toxin-antitoxin system